MYFIRLLTKQDVLFPILKRSDQEILFLIDGHVVLDMRGHNEAGEPAILLALVPVIDAHNAPQITSDILQLVLASLLIRRGFFLAFYVERFIAAATIISE